MRKVVAIDELRVELIINLGEKAQIDRCKRYT